MVNLVGVALHLGHELVFVRRLYTKGSVATYCGVASWSEGVIVGCILGPAKQKTASSGHQHVILEIQKVGRERR
jgi:hypothetical protein